LNPILTEWLIRPGGLAIRLRALREQTGMSGKDFAGRLGWDPTRLSKLERGRQMPTAADLRAWVDLAGEPGALDELLGMLSNARSQQFTFQSRMRYGQSPVQKTYNELVRGATLIRYFEVAYVPGLLQVPDYMRRVFAEQVDLHNLEVDDVDQAIADRLERQQHLYDRSKSFEFILTEAVLRWRLCPTAVMQAQLDRLQTAVGLPNVRFGVLPFGATLGTTPQNKFEAYDDIVLVEMFRGECAYDGEDAAFYGKVMDRLWTEAAEGDEARRLIIRAADELRQSKND
jgi:transcriptional regulator with XRE-family HTH domain